jgi:hypothetical protein
VRRFVVSEDQTHINSDEEHFRDRPFALELQDPEGRFRNSTVSRTRRQTTRFRNIPACTEKRVLSVSETRRVTVAQIRPSRRIKATFS